MQKLIVDLGRNSYPIYVGQNFFNEQAPFLQHIKGKQVFIVTNEVVAPLYLEALLTTCSAYQCDFVLLADGENYKTLDVVGDIFNTLLEKSHYRTTTVIALGGGVIGDMAGFAAACYQRGVNYLQIPTTLLAQVDASVGGKTGVNHPLGKNMIGAFYQPQCVAIDINTLDTLADREYRAGIAEIIKVGLLADAEFFVWLEEHLDALLAKDAISLTTAIVKSCVTKAKIVAEDERETGIRALLNLGHTFAHAIESGTQYKKYLHGEAVAIGLLMAASLSERLGYIDEGVVRRIKAILERAQLPTSFSASIESEQFFELMGRDKKVSNGKQRFILLEKLGKAIIVDDISQQVLSDVIEDASQIET